MPSLNVKDYLLAGACGLALLFAALAGVQGWRASRLKGELSEAKAAELGAKIQATLSDKVRTIEEHRHTIETRIVEVTREAADDVRSAPGGDQPLPAGLRDSWKRAIGRVRSAALPTPDSPTPSNSPSAD